MFDTDRPRSIFAAISPPADVAASGAEPARVPLERLEAQICELAGHLAAATCRFLVLLADFDARRGWASWEMGSCAQWLSWKCQLSSGTAREHVRVARALRDLPVIRARFAQAKLSYAKVRALTRIATPATEAGLAEDFAFYRPDGTRLPPARPCPSQRARSATPTTRRSPRTRSSRPGTANGSTCTTPSGPASPTPGPPKNASGARMATQRTGVA
jgi:hypothetical protein